MRVIANREALGEPSIAIIYAKMQAIRFIDRVEVTVSGPDARGDYSGHPWRTVEEIAKYVEGDGTDAQRVALADGIRRKHI